MPWWRAFMMAVMAMIAKANIAEYFGHANMCI